MSISIWLLFSTVFIVNIGFGIILPTLPFLSKHIGANAFELGMALSVFSAAQLLGSSFWGILSDKKGRKVILVTGIMGYGISSALLGIATNLPTLLAFRFLAGVFAAATMPIAFALVSDWTDLKVRSRILGYMSSLNGLGFIIGPAIGSFLMIFGLTIPFYSVGVLAVINAILATWLLPSPKNKHSTPFQKQAVKTKLVAWFQTFINKAIAPYLLSTFIFAFADSSLMAALAYFIVDYLHSTQAMVGFAFVLIGGVGSVIQALLFSRFNQRCGEIVTIVTGFTLGAAGHFLLGLSTVIALALTAIILIAFCRGFAFPAVITAVSVRSSSHARGSSFGSESTFKNCGRLSGPLVGGWLYAHYGASTFFFSATVLVLTAIVLLVWNYQMQRSIGTKQKMQAVQHTSYGKE